MNSTPTWPSFLPRPTKMLPLVKLRRGYLTNNEESVAVIGVTIDGRHSPLVREVALEVALQTQGFQLDQTRTPALTDAQRAQLDSPPVVLALLLYLHNWQKKWRWAYYHDRAWPQPDVRTWGGSIRFVSQRVDSLHQSP